MKEVRSTCAYCGTGCGIVIRADGDRIVGVEGDRDHPSSRGLLCTKGATLHQTMTQGALAGRARYPEVRGGRWEVRGRVSWDHALDYVADRFAATIREHGPDAVAFYVSGQLLTEDYYVFNKLAKGLIGTANIDTNSRLCMSSAVSGYVATLGADAPPACYEDIDHAACLFIAGSNTAFAHPVLFRRIEAARERNPDLKIIVVDPRRTETARFADLHLAILPGTDVALFHAMLHVMLWERWIDDTYIAAHTEGFDALRDAVRESSPQVAAEICGVRAADIVTAARWFAGTDAERRRPTLSLYCQGLNQSTSGTAKNAALVNLHLATGQIGKPGAGPFSLTGQPNAMGGREVGGLATTLAAHRDLANPEHRAQIERLWRVDRVPSTPGLTAVELFDALASGRVKNVWIACTNPAQSMPDVARVAAALGKAELVVLQDAWANTETAPFADVILPATSWGEKDGTVTNSERRISRVRAAIPKPFEARHDWEIACDFARRLEVRGGRREGTLFPYASAEEIWNEHREATRGRDLDITGLSYAILERDGPQQWPFPEGAKAGAVRLYADGRFPTPSGRARFHVQAYKPAADAVNSHFPLRLNTGRLRDQWHSMTRTGNVASLYGHAPEPRLALNSNDMTRRGLENGDLAAVRSRRGTVLVLVEADDGVRSGQAWLPMHWGKRFLGGRESHGVNGLTCAAFDPVSKQPELKHAAIAVEAVDLPWRLLAFAECDGGEAVRLLDRLQALQGEVAFASAVMIGREHPGVFLRAANEAMPPREWLDALDALLGVDTDVTLRYDDARLGQSRRVRICDDRLAAVRLAGRASGVASGEWLREWLVQRRPVAEIRRLLLSPTPSAPAGISPIGRIVCQCFGVPEPDIVAAFARCEGDVRERIRHVQEELRCGTNCGSCGPELRALAESVPAASSRRVA
jgi:assimilatory nitrate reductase catalytic subunit